jgi:hypothetical protein
MVERRPGNGRAEKKGGKRGENSICCMGLWLSPDHYDDAEFDEWSRYIDYSEQSKEEQFQQDCQEIANRSPHERDGGTQEEVKATGRGMHLQVDW